MSDPITLRDAAANFQITMHNVGQAIGDTPLEDISVAIAVIFIVGVSLIWLSYLPHMINEWIKLRRKRK